MSLYITRRPGESLVIGDDACRITLDSISAGHAKLLFTGGDSFSVYREEIFEEVSRKRGRDFLYPKRQEYVLQQIPTDVLVRELNRRQALRTRPDVATH